MDAQQPIKYPHDHCRNYLPHIENKQYQMITFRLNDSVPRHVVEQWKETLNHLTGSQVGPQVSAPAAAGQQVSAPAVTGSQVSELAKNTDSQVFNFATTNSPFRTHQQEIQYELICWCIMPNHVHTLIAPVEGMSLSEIMYDWKSYTTHAINKALNRKGKLWMMEYFDRYIRDNDHFQKVVNYIHNNPVKAGLVANPSDWRWSSASSQLGGLQVSVPAKTTETATTSQQISVPVPSSGSQVSVPASTTTPVPITQSASNPVISISFSPSPAGRETCEPSSEPTSNEKQ